MAYRDWGPFIFFYEIGGAGGIEGAMKKKTGLKGGASQKNIVCEGVTQKITLKCCNNSIYDAAKFSTKMP